jgi:hypothetical protein
MQQYRRRRRQSFDPKLPPLKGHKKQHIPHLMFLAAVGVPQWYHMDNNNYFFNGKIGIWSFAERVSAARASKNRPQSTLEVKELSVTANVFFDFMTKPNVVIETVRQVI